MAMRVIRALVRPFVAAWCLLMLAWRRVDETLPKTGPAPDQFGDLQFKAGIAALNGQYAQAASIDSKIAVGGGISLAVIALIPSSLAAIGAALYDPSIGHWFILAGVLILLFAFANSVRGLWPRSYRELPDLSRIRELLAKVETDDHALWDIAIPIEQAVIVNERVMKARLATIKIAYSSLIIGFACVLMGFVLVGHASSVAKC